MEGNGYYGENGTGYGDGWGSNSRRNVGMYGSDASYMQRGLYYDGQSSYGGDMGTQRLTGLSGYSGLGGNQRMSNNMHSNLGSRRMDYGYGDTDMTGGTGESLINQYGVGNQSSKQEPYQQLGDAASAEKSMLSSYESEIALMQGGSYAGSTAFVRGASKKNTGTVGNYSGSQQGGSNSFTPTESGSLSYEFNKFSPQKRSFGFGNYETTTFDDARYRLGSGRGFRGRGRGRGRGGYAGSEDNFQKGAKRFSGSHQGPYPKKKKPVVGAKNPVSFLNEIRPNLEFKVGEMEGPSNMPTFTVSLEFDGETYTSSARSKKIAKRYAAEAALKVYLETTAAKQLGYTEDQIDFSSEQEQVQESSPVANNVAATTKSTPTQAKEDDSLGGKNPVMYLNEIKKGAVYDLKEETGTAHNKNFIMRVTVEGQSFEGSGQSKKLAKAAAAREALRALGMPNVVMPLAKNNKGYQMLQKMGWSGSGLGAREQGSTKIVEPSGY